MNWPEAFTVVGSIASFFAGIGVVMWLKNRSETICETDESCSWKSRETVTTKIPTHYLGRHWTVFDNSNARNQDGCDWWVVPDGETDPRVCKCPRKQDAEEIAARLNGQPRE